jgi:phage terminase large subunit GpA-like protein
MPTIPNSPSSGSAIYSAGLTGAEVRGPSHYTAGGEVIRPDLALIDDPQTRESAKSPTQTQDRLDLIKGDVLGQAGDGKPMAALAAVTVIKPADLSSRLLDREEHPDWQGEVVPMVVAWPSEAGQKLWDQYARIRAEDVAAGGSGARATAFYAEHRDAMDSGVAVSDAARHSDGELSAIQHAYNWRCRVGDEVFWAEYQNAPKVAESVSGEVTPLARILKQLSGLPRGTVPRRAGHVTAFIDVGKKILYWMACAWADDFTGWIVDYGTYPDQGRWHFRGDDAQHTIRRKHQGVVDEEAVRLAIEACGAWLLGRDWPREDGPPQRVERLHIDRGYMRPSVELACRRLTGNVLPSAGQGVGPAQRAMSEYRRRPGERIGHYWWMPNVRGTSELRHVRPDTNYWKSLVHQRLAMGLAEKGALSLPGRNPTEHQLLAEHLTAEVCHPTYGRDRWVNVWTELPNHDNHWLDCLVGCAVAASMQGVRVASEQEAAAEKKPRRFTQADLQRRR